MKTSRGYQPRNITHPETLRIGDTISVSFHINTSTTQTYTGTIASREHYGHNITSYYDQDGFCLLTLEAGKTARKITLIKPAPELSQIMLDM
jgi:hypothetical protein